MTIQTQVEDTKRLILNNSSNHLAKSNCIELRDGNGRAKV